MSAAIDLALRAAIVLSLTWIATAFLRKRAASVRALVWTMGLAGILALPALSQITPAWTIAVWQEPIVVEASQPAPSRIDMPIVIDERTPRARSEEPIVRVDATHPAPPPAPRTAAEAPAATPVDWNARGLFVWALLTSVLLARIAASHSRMNGLLAEAGPADAAWIDLVNELRPARGVRRAVNVRATEAVSVPAIVGVLTPTLLLPADAGEWNDETRRAVVLHELAHVARWDALAQLAGQIACAIYWFIPLAWYGARRAAALRERASDDEVLRAGIRASAYAERLIDLARGAGSSDMQLAALAMARPSRMRERVVAILDPAARRDGLSRRVLAAALVLSASAITAVAAASPSPAETVFLPSPLGSTRDSGADAQVTSRPIAASTETTLERIVTPAPGAQPASAAEAVAAAEPVAAQAASRMCDGSESSNSIHSENGRRKWTMKISGGACKIDLRAEGDIEFTSDFTDIASVGSNGFFRLDVTEGGVRRQLEIESRGGSMARTWRVDGREQPYDAAARTWFAAFLIELDRRTAIGADVRIPHLLRQGGVNAVLNETAQMPSDYVRGEYYKRLAQKTRLSSADVTRVLEQAASLSKSDYYGTELIKSFGSQNINDAQSRAAMTRLIDRMDSDYYRAESIQVLVGSGRRDTAEMDFLVRMLGRMKSDHYKTQVLARVLTGATLTADQQAQLASAAANIDSDYYASEFLRQLIRARGTAGGVRVSFLEAVRQIQSDHYRTGTLSALLEQSDVSERELLIMVDLSAPMSDHYESEALRKIVGHRNATRLVREAVRVSADRLASYYRDQVRHAAGER